MTHSFQTVFKRMFSIACVSNLRSIWQSIRLCLAMIGTLWLAMPLVADDTPSTNSQLQNESSQPAVTLGLSVEEVESSEGEYAGEVVIGERTVSYRAKASSMEVIRDEGTVKARVFYTEYLQSGVVDVAKRPVTFCFNGGPGSASLWLHIGGISPRRIEFSPNELQPTGWKLKPNQYSILDQTDLVFIDPVSTGYSRAEKDDERKEFTGFDNDVASVSEFIRKWTATNGRWSSPQYVLGESYGGIRGAAVAGYLQREFRYALEGVVFVSPVIDFQTIRFSESNDLPHVLFLPSYTAVAWHHGRLSQEKYPTMKAAIEASEQLALGEYAAALLAGDRLSRKRRLRLCEKLADLTGMTPAYWEAANLRVTMGRFAKELLRNERRIVGRFDGRFTTPDWDGTASNAEFDPSGSFISGAFVEAIQQYYFDEFGLRETRPYLALSGKVHPWDYSRFEGRFANATDTLRETMTQNPNLKVLFTLGYTDLATPYMGSEHTINHLGLSPSLKQNISIRYYDAGHMMYLRESEQIKLKQDLDLFYSN